MKYNNLSNQIIIIDDKEITSSDQGSIHKVINSNSVAKIYKNLHDKKGYIGGEDSIYDC